MTTRTRPTAADLAGTSARGQAAYNERRANLAGMGIDIPDRYGQGEVSVERVDSRTLADRAELDGLERSLLGDETFRRTKAEDAEIDELERSLSDKGVDPLLEDPWMWRTGRPN